MLTKEQIFGILRHILTTAGGALVAKGAIDEATLMEGVGAVVTLVGVAWSFWVKKNAAVEEAPAEVEAAEDAAE